MAPKYILEQFLQQELLINITEHEVGPGNGGRCRVVERGETVKEAEPSSQSGWPPGPQSSSITWGLARNAGSQDHPTDLDGDLFS